MTHPRFLRCGAFGLFLCAAALTTQAAVVEHADLGGFRTFQDTLTGNVWVDLDARFELPSGPSPQVTHASYGAYLSALQAAGFVWATTSQVMALMDSLPFSSNAAAAQAEAAQRVGVMSSVWGSEFSNMMGIAENTSTPTGQRRHGIVLSSLPQWGTFASSLDFSEANGSNTFGLWALQPGQAGGGGQPSPNAVPEPAGWGLAALAWVGVALQRRRKLLRVA